MISRPRKYAANTRDRPSAAGNPGKPRGARHRASVAAEALLDGEAAALTRKAIELALGGDTFALCSLEYARSLFQRFLPKQGAAQWQQSEFAAITTKLRSVRNTIDRRLHELAGDPRRQAILRDLTTRTAVNVVGPALLDPGGPETIDERALTLIRESHQSVYTISVCSCWPAPRCE
jgi:hypothetical protein